MLNFQINQLHTLQLVFDIRTVISNFENVDRIAPTRHGRHEVPDQPVHTAVTGCRHENGDKSP